MSNQEFSPVFNEILNRPLSTLFDLKSGFYGFLVDATLDKILPSPALTDELGIIASDLGGLYKLIHQDDLKSVQRCHRNAFMNQEDYKCTYRLLQRDGSHTYFEESGKVITGGRSEFSGILCQLNDRSDRKELEEDLRTALEMARFPMENPYPVFRVESGGKLLFANSPSVRLLEKLGLKEGVLHDKPFLEILNQSLREKQSYRYVLNIDEQMTFSLFISPAIAESYANVYTSDVSEAMELQRKLTQRVADLDAVINSTDEVIVLIDNKQNILAFNHKAESLSNSMFGKKLTFQSQPSDYFEGAMLLAFERQFNKCLFKGEKYEFEYEFPTSRSEKLWFKVLFSPVFEEVSSTATGVCLSIKDITESKDDLMQVEAQKSFYETILDNIPADIAIFDDQHRYLYVNTQGIKDKNLRTWMIGKTDYDYCKFRGIGTSIADERRALFASVLKNKKEMSIESEHVMTDGSMKYMLRKFYPFYQNGQLKLMIGYGVDISEVKQIQKSYMQSEHRYRTLFENNPLMVFILDKAGTILSTNASVSSELGFIEKQLLNRPMINFFPEVNRADINGKLSTCFENPDKEFEWETRISKKSGKLIDTEIRAKVIYSVSGAPQLLLV
ncbi:MAG: PAS domain S-box protein, partial [Bacteroidota bacterium]